MSYSTEAEAAKKWCPMVREAVAVGPAGDVELTINKLPDTGPYPYCVGSACMMWRKGVLTVDTKTDKPVTTHKMMQLIAEGAKGEQFASRWADYGYCGLAGKPE